VCLCLFDGGLHQPPAPSERFITGGTNGIDANPHFTYTPTTMAKSCIITGKSVTKGYKVSHSNRRVKRTFTPNLHKKRMRNPATGRMVTVMISARGLRTLEKWMAEGRSVDLTAMKA
jgi:large subunit ribosomal protein L28